MLALGLLLAYLAQAAPTKQGVEERDVYTNYPYTGPAVPVGDWLDQSIDGNGTGFTRLKVPPAVWPSTPNPTNNINTIALAYVPGGINIHFSTPFGIGGEPCVDYGPDQYNLNTNVKGKTTTYGRTPSCSESKEITICSEYFHDVQITGLNPGTTYFYRIPGGNGTTPSQVLSFTTAPAAGDSRPFSVAVINDMGYTNAIQTHEQLINAVETGVAFAWHGGDISYADNWYLGTEACTGQNGSHCYAGNASYAPPVYNPEYSTPLPAGEIPNQGSPRGGDVSVIYETNWDLWQNWMSTITARIPYMTSPGNHEAACTEGDSPGNVLSNYLQNGVLNQTQPNSTISYYSCPASQRNFTAYQYRFRMPGEETGGVGNFWYSFDYGQAHFVSFSGETDYYQSPEAPFVADLKGDETMPLPNQTSPKDGGPFGYINGSYKINENYEQWQWLKQDLASVDRSKTPWVFVQSHRPMYSSEVSSYQTHMRAAFEQMFLDYKVDVYTAGHIHWFERMIPLGFNGTVVPEDKVDNHTYITGTGKSLTHITNGQAGNVESHSTFASDGDHLLNTTQYLNMKNFGFSRLQVFNASVALWEFIEGVDGGVHDYVYLKKQS